MVVTPDNSTLIISESFAGRLIAFDIAADGSLTNRRLWADGLGPDGSCMDAEGAVWVQTADTPHKAPSSGSARAGRCWRGSSTTARSFATMLGGPDRAGAHHRGTRALGRIAVTHIEPPYPGGYKLACLGRR